MSLKLYFHPLSSFCHKVLVALYECGAPFEPVLVDPGDEASSAAFKAVWPVAKMPALRDEDRACTVGESTIIIEYLDTHYRGATRLIPDDPDRAWRTRLWDRFYDHYFQHPMQKIVGDRLRPESARDLHGVAAARSQLEQAYAIVEAEMSPAGWMMGDDFTMADCAATPALFYANTVMPFRAEHTHLSAYFGRLTERPSVARVLKEAEPYFDMFPMDKKPQIARPDGQHAN